MRLSPLSLSFTLMLWMLLGWIGLMLWSLGIWWHSDYLAAENHLQSLLKHHALNFNLLPMAWLLSPYFKLKTICATYLNQLAALEQTNLQACVITFINQTAACVHLVALTLKCIFMKLLMLITSIPLFVITLLLGLVDGLSQRAIRTACLGRESSYLFHQLTRYMKHGLVLFLSVWFVMPFNIKPALVFIPMSLFLGVMTAMTASRFKKYW